MQTMSVPKAERARQASNAIDDGTPVACGEYTAIDNGDTSSCIRAVLAHEFRRYHEVQPGDKLDVWMDYESGALIVLPGN